MKILMILTSYSDLGSSGKKTGFWVDEFAAPYYLFLDAGFEVTLASPAGGKPPIDPRSEVKSAQTKYTKRFDEDPELQKKLAHTMLLEQAKAKQFDAVFYPGGHGLLWDLVKNRQSIQLIEEFIAADKPIGFVCHSPAVLINVKAANGSPYIHDKALTGFSNSEEKALELTEVVPFLLENELLKLGANYSNGADWESFVVQDGQMVTGQNPGSSAAVAKILIQKLNKKVMFKETKNVKPTAILIGLLAVAVIFLMSSCNRKIAFETSTVVPAARGDVKVTTDKNKNYVVNIQLYNLAEVERLQPARKAYVVWLVTEKGEARNIGQIKSGTGSMSSKLHAKFESVTSTKPTKIFLTAEDDPSVLYSSNQVVLTTGNF